MAFKPTGYNSASPYLVVSDAKATIAFLEQVFDAKVLRSYPGENGRVAHAEVRIDDTVVMLGDAADQWPAIAAHVHVYVPDVDKTYAKALAGGAATVQAPIKNDDEDKRGGVKDSGGTTWWISTQTD